MIFGPLLLIASSAVFAGEFSELHHYGGTCTAEKSPRFCAYFAPQDMPIHVVAEYLKSAKKSIRIATYNMDVEHYVGILEKKLANNVTVDFMVDYDLSYGSNLVWRLLKNHPKLSKLRLPVMRGGNPQMHNKIIMIDNEVVLLGSANWTYSGLVANYENVLAIRDSSVIAKVNEELDELRDIAKKACELFASPKASCGKGSEKWDAKFHTLVTTGKMDTTVLKNVSGCKSLPFGLLNAKNQPVVKDLASCVTDPRYSELANYTAQREKSQAENQKGEVQVYFSPEDGVENIILRELRSTLENPEKSFAYIATNFITNARLAETLVEMSRAGVRMKIFFDRGRLEDGNFQAQVKVLEPLGFTKGETEVSKNTITVFNNTLTGPFGCNHNKFAVIGTPKGGVHLLNGSANWSQGAMTKNDENLLVIENPLVAAIYARELLSQLYVYRYFQEHNSAGFQDDLRFLSENVPCLGALVGTQTNCTTPEGVSWKPRVLSAALLSVGQDFADATKERVWVNVPQLNDNKGGVVELFTHEVFSGRWMTSVPVPPGWKIDFKFFKTPKNVDASTMGLAQAVWEYGGVGNERTLDVAPLGLHVIRDRYTWGTR